MKIPTGQTRPLYEPGELIVKLKRDSAVLEETLCEKYGVSLIERFELGNRPVTDTGELVRLKLPRELAVEEAVQLLSKDAQVEYAEPNNRYYLDSLQGPNDSTAPNDLNYKLWGLHNTGQTRGTPGADISMKEAWKITKGDRAGGPIVAVIDSGVDVSHPDLLANLWVNPGEIPNDGVDNDGNGVVDDVHGYNAFHDNNDLFDGKVHGTHVAGTVGAVGNNGQGITGVAQEARIMTVKIFANTGHTNEATVLRGLAYADKMGARITTNSWGGIHSKAMEEAYSRSPALHIASAGNSGRDNDVQPHFPGSYPIDNMIAVAASDHRDEIGSFSCYGDHTVHLAAPGVDIYSTLPRGRYKSFSGTSMACPHVGGAASLILSEYPYASNEEVKNRILYGTDPLPKQSGLTVSGGRLNAASSLENDLSPPGTPGSFRAEVNPSEVRLAWTNSGDDGEVGQARALLLKKSEHPLNEKNFASATSLGRVLPGRAGDNQLFTDPLSWSDTARTFYYGLQAIDNVGNRSELTTLQVTVTPS
jgi:subtilisin family serine protease